ncbi:MAG: transposase [Pseudomonadota bacterium]
MTSMPAEAYSAHDVAEVLDLTDRGVRARAIRGEWESVTMPVMGGSQHWFFFSSLPMDVRVAMVHARLAQEVKTPKAQDAEAHRRVLAAASVAALVMTGVTKTDAIQAVSGHVSLSVSSVSRWVSAIEDEPQERWMAVLSDRALRLVEEKAAPRAEELKGWQREAMEARLVILRHLDQVAGEMGVNRAVEMMCGQASQGKLPGRMMELLPRANARSGGKDGARTLSARTLKRWRSALAKGGITALAPAAPESVEPPWGKRFLELYKKPHNPAVSEALEDLGEEIGKENLPTVSAASRYLKKRSALELARGRMTGGNLSAVVAFTRRSMDRYMPLDVVQIDGHSFKARVAHPVHGGPIHPECCGVICGKTRVFLGWSVGFAESASTVAGAIRHAVTVNADKWWGGVPAIIYADNGSGNICEAVSGPGLGVIDRIGSTFQAGRAGNAKGRGLVEVTNKNVWIRAARALPSCTHDSMDSGVQRKVYIQTLKDLKKDGKSDLLPTWEQFVALCAEYVDRYNNRPHSALPKITDPATGRRRHRTPLEEYRHWLEKGWRPTLLPEAELADLFRPQAERVVDRGWVSLFSNKYFHPDLVHFHGRSVLVGYDEHDPMRVWIRDHDQRMICVAEWERNTRDFYPVAVVERAAQKRADGQIRLLENKAAAIRAEAGGVLAMAPVELSPEEDARALTLIERSEAREAAVVEEKEIPPGPPFSKGGERLPANDFERYEMILDAGSAASVEDREWAEAYEERLMTPRRGR